MTDFDQPNIAPFIIRNACIKTMERMDAMGYTGKRRDTACLDYLCGYVSGLAEIHGLDHAVIQRLLSFLQYGVAFRGYFEVKKRATEEVGGA